MATVAPKQKSSQANQWWFVEQLIAGLDASAQVKLLLFLVQLHYMLHLKYKKDPALSLPIHYIF